MTRLNEPWMAQVPEDERWAVAERAAILEYEAHRPRGQAELLAILDWYRQKTRKDGHHDHR